MGERSLHPELEARLMALANRIAHLKRSMKEATGLKKVEDFGEIEELEQRYKVLEDRLSRLNREGPGFRQDMKAAIEMVADDLTGAVEEFMMRLDRGYQPDQRSRRLPKT